MKRKVIAMLSAVALLFAMVAVTGTSLVSADAKADASWFSDAKFGIAVRYLNAEQNNAESVTSGGATGRWSNCVDEFDVDLFALHAAQSGADYVLLTMQQADRYFCAPNKAYTNLIQKAGVDALDACSTRDLPAELADALSSRGIKLMLSVTADGPWQDTAVYEQVLDGENAAAFKANWLKVIEEYASRYGSKVAGWFVEGANPDLWSADELQDFADVLKTYNSAAVVSFNADEAEQAPHYYVAADDFTAGKSTYFDEYPSAKYLDSSNTPTNKGGVLWHTMATLHDVDGKGRGYAGYTAEEMKDYVTAVNEKGGVVTVDMSVGRSGAILTNELDVLKGFGGYDNVKYEIVQNFETDSSRKNSAHAKFEAGSAVENAVTYNPNTTQTPLNGSSSFFSGLLATGWGADHVVKEAPVPAVKNANGVFFRLRHNRSTTMALCVTTSGTSGTGIHDVKYDLTHGNSAMRYYNLDGELISIGKTVPGNFDGYVFVPADLSGKTLDGITLVWVDAWYNESGAESRWHNGHDWDAATIVGVDDIGYFSASSDEDYEIILEELLAEETQPTPPAYVEYEYEVVQDYEGENANGSQWGHANYVDGSLTSASAVKDPDVAQSPLSGSGSHFSQITAAGVSGSDFLVADAATMSYSLENPTGIFFRMKTNRSSITAMYVSTLGGSSGDYPWGGNNSPDHALMNWNFNNACLDARYYALDGTDKTVYNDGRVVPANFDGYVFIPFDVSSKSLEGLTIMYAQSWAMSEYTLSDWYSANPVTVVGFDNVGFYTASGAEGCKAIIQAVEGSYEPPSSQVEIDSFQTYETDEEKANATAVNNVVKLPDGNGYMTNRYETVKPLSGGYSRELYWIYGAGSSADYLVKEAPASQLKKTTGIYLRLKVTSTAPTPLTLHPTADTDGQISDWPNGAIPVQYYTLDGEHVLTNAFACPAGFDGYAFIPTGDIEGKAIAAMMMDTWYGNAYSGMTTAVWWNSSETGGTPKIWFDNIGYYYTAFADAADYKAIIDLAESSYVPEVEFERFQSYETPAERENAAPAGSRFVAGDNAEVSNRYVTANAVNGAYSREIYFIGNGYGADYLAVNAPASTLESPTGIYIRIKMNTEKDFPFVILPTTDKDGTLTWPNQVGARAVEYYDLEGNFVSASDCLCPAGFDGYAFIPCGDISDQAVAAVLLPYWYANAYGDASNAVHCWNAGPSNGIPTLLFDDIGYYYAPNNGAAVYKALIEQLQVPVTVDREIVFEVVQDYETQEARDNSSRGSYENGGAVASPVTFVPGVAQPALSGNSSFFSELLATGWGTDHVVSHLAEPTIDNATGIFFRLKSTSPRSTVLCVTTAGVDTDGLYLHNPAYDLAMFNTAVRYYNQKGELVATGEVVPANFDGYVFIPANLSAMTLDGLTFHWIDAWYGGNVAEGRWHSGSGLLGGGTIVGVDNIGYYSAPEGATDADYAAMIAAVRTERKDFRDLCREDMAIAVEARGLDTTDALSAALLTKFDAAVSAAADEAEAEAIFRAYRADMAALGNKLRLNVGAGQIRESDSALRFVMEVDQDFLAYMEKTYTNVEFGTLLARSDYYTGELVCSDTVKSFSKTCATTIKRTSTFTLTADQYTTCNGGNTLVYTCVLRNIPESAYEVGLRACNFLKYTDGDTEYILYSEEINTTYQTVKTMSSDASTNTVSPFDQVSEAVYLVDPDNTGLRVLFVGNSITRHGPLEDIGWSGDWGMAASSADKDYVHVSMNRIKETHPDAAFALCSASAWEASYRTADATMLDRFAAARRFDADIIVLRVAENCDNSKFTAEDKALFVRQLENLVNYLNADGEAGVLVTTGFWDAQVDAGLIEYAEKYDYPLVDLNDLGYQDQYKAIGEYWHSGVCSHPNDAGMAEIAKRICDTMEEMEAFQVPVEE